jgi:2-keto-4-pentenoate hydratase/2-oxohepta-3-ene-1,7-dioic acid hydratase in catechol pathway
LILRFFVGAFMLLFATFIGGSYWISKPLVEGERGVFAPEIAEFSEALTFARTAKALVLVTGHSGDGVTGIDLTAIYGEALTSDLSIFLQRVTPQEAASSVSGASHYPLDQLISPVAFSKPSVAAGTNFREHADEVYSDDPPFLFPKLTQPGFWHDAVPFLPRLDFEAEVCAFPLSDIRVGEALPTLGWVLCNDFTDRLTLMKEIDLGEPLGRTGFAAGKGCAGCLPTGYLVVVPQSPAFYRGVSVALYVNDQLRQQFDLTEMILSIEAIIAKALEDGAMPYQKGSDTVPLLPGDTIRQNSLILTGTGAGVLFKPLNIWGQQFYLQRGDVVRTEATYLGHLVNRIE